MHQDSNINHLIKEKELLDKKYKENTENIEKEFLYQKKLRDLDKEKKKKEREKNFMDNNIHLEREHNNKKTNINKNFNGIINDSNKDYMNKLNDAEKYKEINKKNYINNITESNTNYLREKRLYQIETKNHNKQNIENYYNKTKNNNYNE